MKYTLLLVPDEGPVLRKRIAVDHLDVREGEYAFARRARELYRDALHAQGLWPTL